LAGIVLGHCVVVDEEEWEVIPSMPKAISNTKHLSLLPNLFKDAPHRESFHHQFHFHFFLLIFQFSASPSSFVPYPHQIFISTKPFSNSKFNVTCIHILT